MPKKKRRKRRSRIPKSTNYEPETNEQQRKKFPEALVKTFVAISNNGWEDEKLYQKFVQEEKKYLGKLYEDKIEQGKLVVLLARATMDLREKPTKRTKVIRKKRGKKKC